MDRKIIIQVNTPTRSASGDTVDSWGAFATVWAEKRDVSGGEAVEAGRQSATVRTEFSIWHLDGVTAGMRVSYGGALYDIEGVLEMGRREGLRLLCALRGA